MSVATDYRLLVTGPLPSAVSRAIWLDCDLVVTDDLARLWDMDLAGRHALAVQDHGVPFVYSPGGVAQYERLGLPADDGYFNAGVMLLDLDSFARTDSRAGDHILQHRDTVVFWDQEALNAVLAGKWGRLTPSKSHRKSPRRPPARWAGRCLDLPLRRKREALGLPDGRSFARAYYRYLDQTAWAGWRPKRSLAGAVIATYLSSRLRTMLYPTEEWLMGRLRTLTRKYATDPERPAIWVILGTDTYETIRPVVECLRRQIVKDRVELVIIAPRRASLGMSDTDGEGLAAVRFVEVGDVSRLAVARAAGVRAAPRRSW